jgi:hypothetical protein
LTVSTNVTLASSNSALPDDGDYTETCWSCFNVDFNTPLKICASVGVKNLDNIKMHGTTVKIPHIYYKRRVLGPIPGFYGLEKGKSLPLRGI